MQNLPQIPSSAKFCTPCLRLSISRRGTTGSNHHQPIPRLQRRRQSRLLQVYHVPTKSHPSLHSSRSRYRVYTPHPSPYSSRSRYRVYTPHPPPPTPPPPSRRAPPLPPPSPPLNTSSTQVLPSPPLTPTPQEAATASTLPHPSPLPPLFEKPLPRLNTPHPNTPANNAFWACIRFSAWSQTF